ncbi:hypothetical protein MLD38_010238 [Melastoma candidum]|uniref:Uncharacterized protein n=1 Tax=Melastoma candidum TaxID=119954 RepID=A0ACB9R2A9_9MYRT|nr:hypothetical protein MLD38_010238 [Melastoma candidum]
MTMTNFALRISWLWGYTSGNPCLQITHEDKIVVVGLDNAGKTTTLYKLLLAEVVTTHLTIRPHRRGGRLQEYPLHGCGLECPSVVGLGPWWTRKVEDVLGYVLPWHPRRHRCDKHGQGTYFSNEGRALQALGHGDLQGSVLLVFANKQDIKDAMTPTEITDGMFLHSIKNHDWHIQACCALTGEGLYDGLRWIARRMTGRGPI